jgi:glycosyltransferase involved in cell wall biosynthesis
MAEYVLTARAPRVAACSPLEASHAKRFPRADVVYVPNVMPSIGPETRRAAAATGNVVAVGRLCAQKAPELFGRAASIARMRGHDWNWIWIGGGDDDLAAYLSSCGVTVTGWRPRSEVVTMLRTASAYVHTAAWEGAPITLLEAAASGLPIFARNSDALASLGAQPLWSTTAELIDQLGELFGGGTSPAHDLHRALASRHHRLEQAAALKGLYSVILSR